MGLPQNSVPGVAQAPWFILLILGGLGLSGVGVLWLRTRHLKEREGELLRQVDARACQLQLEVTERQRVEKTLRQKEAEFRELYDDAPVAYHELDTQGRFVRVNNKERALLGYTLDEMLGRSVLDFVVNPGLARSSLTAKLCGEVPLRPFERLYRKKDGTLLPVLIEDRLVRDSEGRVIGIRSALHDITERKQAEEALRRSEQKLSLHVQQMQLGVIEWNLSFQVTEWNPAAERIFGYSRSEALGKHATFILPESERHLVDRSWSELLAQTGGTQSINENSTKDGHVITCQWHSTPLIDKEGHTIGAASLVADITKSKKAEAELLKAKEAAESANRSKSEFLANMSHEIRTPMNGIMGMTELALDTNLSGEQREYLEIVKSSADSLLTVIDDILDFSKIEAGRLALDPIDFSLRESLGETLKTLAFRAHQKGLELVGHVLPEVPDALVGDPGRLRQIVVNLVGNAIKFTERGEVVVEVAVAEPRAVPADRTVSVSGEILSHEKARIPLEFSVADTGIGIAEEKQRVIFDAFSQADGSTTRRYGGTGLGLTISNRLAQMMGGRLWVESQAGVGSTFRFTAQLGVQAVPVPPPAWLSANIENLRVLVVDDNATNRRILVEMLSHWRMRPVAVENAARALAALADAQRKGEPFPLLLTDVNMPEMDGFMLAEEICRTRSSLETAAELPKIIMLTSAGIHGDSERSRRLGVAAYLTKPVRQSELLNALMMVVGARVESPAPLKSEKVETAPPDRVLSVNRTALRILLAEDNAVNQRLAVRLLEKQGHAVAVAGTGRAALFLLEKEHFDLVLMDVQMPEMDGMEATQAIRSIEAEIANGTKLSSSHSTFGRHRAAGTRIPIVAMTAHAMVGDRERCLAAGMDSYISKPVQPRQLFGVIAEMIPQTEASPVSLA